MTDKRDQDLQDVLRSERNRGRKQKVDVDQQRLNRRRKEQVISICQSGTEDELRSLLREWEYAPEEIEEHIKLFRSLRGL